jgi:hypothetical protein
VLRRSVEITGVKQPCRRNPETAEFDQKRSLGRTDRAMAAWYDPSIA